MKRIGLLGLVALALWPRLALGGPAEDAAATIDRWAAAYTESDPTAMAKLYAANATVFGAVKPELRIGPEHIVRSFAHWPKEGSKMVIRYRRITMLSDHAAVAVGYCQFRWMIDGKAYPRRARFSMSLVKQDDRWLIANQHFSPLVSQLPTPELVPPEDRQSIAPQ